MSFRQPAQTIDAAEIAAYLDRLYESMASIPGGFDAHYRYKIRNIFYTVREGFNNIPYQSLTPQDHRRIRNLTEKMLPKGVRQFYMWNNDLYIDSRNTAFRKAVRILNTINREHALRDAAVITKPVRNAIAAQPSKPQLPDYGTWPNLAGINRTLDQKVQHLQRQWHLATSTLQDIDDTYFLKRIVTEDLPHSWQMYGDVLGMPEELVNQAQQLLETQLDILTAKVSTIAVARRKYVLDRLIAQTEYIRDSTAPARQLTIEA